jgi:16S rRNA processing protein RimM
MANPDPMVERPDLLEVGRIGRPHGIRGEVYVILSSDRTERLAVGSRLHTNKHGELVVDASRPHNDRWLVTFAQIPDRTAAERLVGVELFGEPIDDPDAVWVDQLIGASVIEAGGVERGRCIGVIKNPAHDILELDSGALVPAVFITSCVDGVVTIDPPDGLFDLG